MKVIFIPDGGNKAVNKSKNHALQSRVHDLTEADTHALPLALAVAVQTLLQDGDDFLQDSLPKLPHEVTKSPCRYLPGQDPVPPLCAEHSGDDLLTGICPDIVIILGTGSGHLATELH